MKLTIGTHQKENNEFELVGTLKGMICEKIEIQPEKMKEKHNIFISYTPREEKKYDSFWYQMFKKQEKAAIVPMPKVHIREKKKAA